MIDSRLRLSSITISVTLRIAQFDAIAEGMLISRDEDMHLSLEQDVYVLNCIACYRNGVTRLEFASLPIGTHGIQYLSVFVCLFLQQLSEYAQTLDSFEGVCQFLLISLIWCFRQNSL